MALADYMPKIQIKQNINLEKVGPKHCIDSIAFIKYSNDMQDVYKNRRS